MPDLSSNLAELRAGRHRLRWYLGAFVGSTVLTGTVTADAADGATSLAYTTSIGSSANVKRGFLVVVTTSGGALKGFWRVRAAGTLSATALPITELSAGSVDINTGDLLEVRDVILPGAKVVEADANFRPDGVAAGTYNSAIPPMANAGPHWVGFVDAGQTYATVAFVGSLSYAVDGDSGGTVTYSWSAPTATGTTSSTSADPSFTFEAGEHLVTLTVTDSSNSSTWTTYRKVRVYSDAAPPWEVVPESIESDAEQGTYARFRIFEDGSLDDLPDGSLVCLFAREYMNGVEQSFGNAVSSRAHMKALGYLRRESNANNADDGTKELSFEIISPMQFYRELVTGYSKVALHDTGANAWGELDDLSVKRMLVQIPRWYTWLTEFHDLTFHSSFDDRDYAAFYIQRSNPIDQMHELADGVDARITCDRTGRVEVQMRPELIAEGSRSGITTWGTFTDDDRADYSFEREHWRPIEMIEGRGFTAGTSGNAPIFSRWPGRAPGAGIQSTTVERLIADSQSDLNTRLGRRAAWDDGVYFTSTGVMHRAISGEVTFPGGYWLDPAYCEYLVLDFDADTNLREIDLAEHRFVVQRVSTEIGEAGTAQQRVGYRTATNGPAGVTYVPPQEDGNGFPDWTPPDFSFPTFPTLPEFGNFLYAGTQSLGAVNTDGYLYYCGPSLTGRGFDVPAASSGPLWARAALSVTGTVMDAVQSALTAARLVVVTTDDDAIYTVDNPGASPTVTLVKSLRAALTDTTTQWRMVDASFGADYIVVVTNYGSDGGVWYTYSLDGGETWSTETQVTAHYNPDSGAQVPGLFVSSRSPGQAEFGVFTASGSGSAAQAEIYRVTGTFGSPTGTGVSTLDILPSAIHRSWADNEATLYYGYGDLSQLAANRSQTRRKDGGGAPVDITPTIGGNKCRPFRSRGIHACPIDASTVLAAVGGHTSSAVVMSRNKGTAWTQLTSGTTTSYDSAEVAGNNRDVGYVWGASGAIGYVDLAAQAIDDRRGNIPTDFSGAGRFVRIFGL